MLINEGLARHFEAIEFAAVQQRDELNRNEVCGRQLSTFLKTSVQIWLRKREFWKQLWIRNFVHVRYASLLFEISINEIQKVILILEKWNRFLYPKTKQQYSLIENLF